MAEYEDLVGSPPPSLWNHSKQREDSGFLSMTPGSANSFELMDSSKSCERMAVVSATNGLPPPSTDMFCTPFTYTRHTTKKHHLNTSLKSNRLSLCDSGYETSHQVSSIYSPMSVDHLNDSLLAGPHGIEETSLYSEPVNHPNSVQRMNMMKIEEEQSFENNLMFSDEKCEDSREQSVTPNCEEQMDFSEYCTSDEICPTLLDNFRPITSQKPKETVVMIPTISPTKSPVKRKCPRTMTQRRHFFVGTERLDILFFLGEKQNYTPVVSQILALLSPRDLSAVNIVCKAWQRIVANDTKAYKRWRRYANKLKRNCENLPATRKGSAKSKIASLHRTELSEIGNRGRAPSTPEQSQLASPTSSPSKLKFNLFQKEIRKLESGEELLQCPRCLLPARLFRSPHRLAQCLRLGCQFRFCALCNCVYHEATRCELMSSTPRVRKRLSSIGSKESKKNLRRL